MEYKAVVSGKSNYRAGMNLTAERFSTTMSSERNPIHEEYLLQAARDNFKKDTQDFFKKVLLRDIDESKNLQLLKIKQNQLCLKHSKTLLDDFSKHRKKFDERVYIFLARSRYEVRNLHQDCRSIKEELTYCRDTINAMFPPKNSNE